MAEPVIRETAIHHADHLPTLKARKGRGASDGMGRPINRAVVGVGEFGILVEEEPQTVWPAAACGARAAFPVGGYDDAVGGGVGVCGRPPSSADNDAGAAVGVRMSFSAGGS